VISGDKWKTRKFSDIFRPTGYVGVYWRPKFNYTDSINQVTKQHEVYDSKTYWDNYNNIPIDRIMDRLAYEFNTNFYGVADNIEQVVELYNKNEDGWFKGNHVIFCTKILKDPDYPGSGWRWHKWGPYIGTKDPQCEYLNDEPEIDEVVVFNIYKVI
jgi:hypothetical protein